MDSDLGGINLCFSSGFLDTVFFLNDFTLVGLHYLRQYPKKFAHYSLLLAHKSYSS